MENRAGASGAIGARSVATANPDGLTLLVGQTAEVAINQHWLKSISYDPDKDLQAVALLAIVPLALVVPSKAPYSTMAEFLAALKTAKLTFASAGTGTPGHFAGEFLKAKTKSDLTHVPYKGAGPALNDLIGGHVDLYFPGTPAANPLLKGGLAKVLAVSSAKRSGIMPDVPTVAESTGWKDFDFTLWAGVFTPRGTPPDIVAKLNSRNQQGAQRSRRPAKAGRCRRRGRHHVGRTISRIRGRRKQQVCAHHQGDRRHRRMNAALF